MLYAHLHAYCHRTFNDFCVDAMDFDDNFNASSQENDRERKQMFYSNESSSKDANSNKIVEMMLEGLGETYRPPYRPMGYQ